MKLLLSVLLIVVAVTAPITSRADEASHRKAAESFLAMMDMDNMLSQSIEQMLQMQVQQNPAIAPYRTEMKAFLSKYMSWASMKDDMVKLYVNEFTEAELKELSAFYQTPIGKKSLQKMPTLMAKSAEMAQRRVQEHLPELQASIEAKASPSPKK